MRYRCVLMAGGVISHYQLQSKLGQGGMGIVYRAIDTRLGRVVALKMIPREALGRDDLRKRMLREARAAAMLNHPNVCALYDVDDSLGFLAMECIEGPPLNDVLKGGVLEPAKALDIARQIAEGLAAAHDRNVIHRDIKPSNILLTQSGQVKITDFGLAKCAEEVSMTLTGQILGTPAYMSPEQIRGITVDERTDIWSFGVLLHELVTGSSPFIGESITSLLYSIANDEPRRIPDSAGAERMRFQPIVDLCLAKTPEKRYQRMRDVANALGTLTTQPLIDRDNAVHTTQTLQMSMTGRPSIAVLDFMNRSNDAQLDWLSVAIAETLSSDLRKIGAIRVADRQQVIRVAAQAASQNDLPQTELGVDLGVRWLIRGGIEGSPNELLISADIVNGMTGAVAFTVRESGPLEQVLGVLVRVVLQIAELLGVKLLAHELNRIEQPETQALEAYRLYARGRRLFYTFDSTKMDEARQTFETAVKADPRYGLSWVGLGTVYTFRYIKSTDVRDLQAGIGYLQQAIAVDPDLAEAHTSLSYAYLRLRNFQDGIRAGTKAVELEPSSTAAHYFLAVNYVASATEARNLEHFSPATRHFEESIRLETNYQPGLMMLGWILMLRGRHSDALESLTRASEVERTGRFDVMQMVGAQTLLGLVQYRLGNNADAEQTFRHALEYLNGRIHLYRDLFVGFTHCGLADVQLAHRLQDEAINEFSSARAAINRNPKGLGMGYCMVRLLTGLARSFQKLGMGREAREHLQQATDLFRAKEGYNFNVVWEGCDAQACYDLARACAVMDKRDLALKWLEEAIAAGWHDRGFLLRDESMSSIVSSALGDVDVSLSAETERDQQH